MSAPVSNVVRSERRVRFTVGYVALVMVPVLLLIIVLSTKFVGLSTDALDHAQLARNLAWGRGFATSVVRPIAIRYVPPAGEAPDLSNAPVHPLVLSLCFWLGSPSEKAAAALGLALWVATVWLTYVVANRLWGVRAAAIAVALYGVNLAAINAALLGGPQPLAMLLMLFAVWLAFPRSADKEETTQDLSAWRLLLTGMVCALTRLTDYSLIVFVLVMGVYVVATPPGRWRAFGLFLTGYVVANIPWWYRNVSVSGSPFFTLYWYNLFTNTGLHPGDSIWRAVDGLGMLGLLIENLRGLFVKGVRNFGDLQASVLATLHPVLVLVFVVTLFSRTETRRFRHLQVVVIAGVALSILLICLLKPDANQLVVWTPLLAMAGARRLGSLVHEHVGRLSFPGVSLAWLRRTPHPEDDPLPVYGRMTFPPEVARLLTHMLIVAVVAFPLAHYLMIVRVRPDLRTNARLHALKPRLPERANVVTDQPIPVAWFAECRAIDLWQAEKDWSQIEQHLGPVDAVYITSAITDLVSPDWGDWWTWVSSPRGIYRDLEPAVPPAPQAILRLRREAQDTSAIGKQIERLRAAAEKKPKSSELQERLGVACLDAGYLRAAFEAFSRAAQLDPENAEAVLGTWEVTARLNDTANAMALIQSITQIDTRDQAALFLLKEIAQGIESALDRYPTDTWLSLHAAICYAKLNEWDKAERYAHRVAAMSAEALPFHSVMGNLYLRQGRFKEAATEFATLAKDKPYSLATHQGLGRLRFEQGEWTEAAKHFTKAHELRPDLSSPLLWLARVSMRQKAYVDASGYFRNALQVSPGLLPAKLGFAEALIYQARESDSMEAYEAILADYPDSLTALNNLAYLYCRNGNNLERAVELARRAVTIAPGSSSVQDSLGWALLLAGRADQALAPLQEAVRLAPADKGRMHYHLGKALLATGHKPEAAEALRIGLARELTPEERRDAEAALPK